MIYIKTTFRLNLIITIDFIIINAIPMCIN